MWLRSTATRAFQAQRDETDGLASIRCSRTPVGGNSTSSWLGRLTGQARFPANRRLCRVRADDDSPTHQSGPPGRGDFLVSNFHPGAIPEIWSEMISGGEEVLGRKVGWPVFWATSLEKIFGGVIAIISFRPGGWMQQSAVPRCAILSVGSTGGIGK